MDLNVLESRKGEIIGDPVEAHKVLSEAFSQWFPGLEWWWERLHKRDYFDDNSKSDAAFMQDTNYTGSQLRSNQEHHFLVSFFFAKMAINMFKVLHNKNITLPIH